VSVRRVLPDTNVCYPISLLDLLLRLDEAALHEIIWTDDLLDELVRTWAEKGARSHEAAEHVCEAIRDAFPEGHVQRHEYEHFALGSSGLHDHSRVHALGEEQAGGRVAAVIEPVALHASQHIAISAVLEGGRWRA
jgi:hypothetical protein